MNQPDANPQQFHVFLCHNSKDKPAVRHLAEQLKARGLRPWLDEWELQPGMPWQNLLEAQIQTVASAAVIIGSSGKGPWQNMELAAFIRQFVNRRCPVIPVLLANAPEEPQLPILLEDMTYVDFRKTDGKHSPLDRLIWGITGEKPKDQPPRQPTTPQPGTLPPPDLFVGRQEPLKQLMDGLQSQGGATVITGRLFNLDGAGGMGKTTLAREAAWRLQDQFDGVVELVMDGHTPMSLAMELARRLGVSPKEPRNEAEAQSLVSQLLAEKRILLLLDNLLDPTQAPYLLPQNSPSAVVITTRNKECLALLKIKRRDLTLTGISLERFTPEEAMDLFQEVLGDAWREDWKDLYLEIAEVLGYLPVALRPALNLLVFSPRYSPGQLLEKLKSPALHALLEQGAEKDRDLRTVKAVFDLGHAWLPTPSHRRILEHLACCAPGPVPMDFLEQFCEEDHLQTGLEDLSARSWCQARELEEGRVYVMHDLVREMVRSQYEANPWDRFVDVVDRAYREEPFQVKDRWLPQFQEALTLCETQKDRRQIDWLLEYFRLYCAQRGHGALYVRLADQAAQLFPEDGVLSVATNHKALILMNWGRLKEAFELLDQSIEIKERLEDKQGLAACYGNQAVILKAWGKLEDAHALHKKEQALKEALGDRAGLANCYGNQALILEAWGKLEDAHVLYKKVEALFEALGDRAGLAKCYGNQALILRVWGKLEDAHALHKKEQALSEALGDQAQLARCFWNQGCLLGDQGDRSGQESLLRRALTMYQDLGLPTDFMESELKKLTGESP